MSQEDNYRNFNPLEFMFGENRKFFNEADEDDPIEIEDNNEGTDNDDKKDKETKGEDSETEEDSSATGDGGAEDDDDFEINTDVDDDSEGDSTEDDSNDTDGKEASDDTEDNSEDDSTDDDNFDVDTNVDNGEEDSTDSDATSDEDSGEDKEEDDSSDDVSADHEEVDAELYANLTDEEKASRNEILKSDFKDIFIASDSILQKIKAIQTTADSISIIKHISSSLIDLKKHILYYLQNRYDKNGYIDNDSMYHKYLAILNGIKNIISEINIVEEEKDSKDNDTDK